METTAPELPWFSMEASRIEDLPYKFSKGCPIGISYLVRDNTLQKSSMNTVLSSCQQSLVIKPEEAGFPRSSYKPLLQSVKERERAPCFYLYGKGFITLLSIVPKKDGPLDLWLCVSQLKRCRHHLLLTGLAWLGEMFSRAASTCGQS